MLNVPLSELSAAITFGSAPPTFGCQYRGSLGNKMTVIEGGESGRRFGGKRVVAGGFSRL